MKISFSYRPWLKRILETAGLIGIILGLLTSLPTAYRYLSIHQISKDSSNPGSLTEPSSGNSPHTPVAPPHQDVQQSKDGHQETQEEIDRWFDKEKRLSGMEPDLRRKEQEKIEEWEQALKREETEEVERRNDSEMERSKEAEQALRRAEQEEIDRQQDSVKDKSGGEEKGENDSKPQKLGSSRPKNNPTEPPALTVDVISGEKRETISTPNSPASNAIYNAVFSPRSNSFNSLFNGQKTKVDFYIGEPDKNSAIPRAKASVNQAISSQSEKETLTITLTCGLCDGTSVQEQIIEYSPSTSQKSSDAIFYFIPDRSKTKEGMGNLAFQIKNMGIVYDNIVLDVYVENSGTATANAKSLSIAAPVSKIGPSGVANVVAPPEARAADLTITCFEEGNFVAVTLDPGRNAQLSQLFRGRNMQDAGHPRVFHTGITVSALLQIERNDYFSLASMVDQSPQLMKALSGDPEASIVLSGSTTLTASEEQELLDHLYDQGQTLYRKLFINSADTDLRDLMADFDEYTTSGSPALIRIEAHSINIPWQFLYPPVSENEVKDPHGFWGFRYEIAVDPLAEKAPGYYPNIPLQYGQGPLLLATYQAADSDTSNDREVSSDGEKMYTFLGSTIGFKGITNVHSRKDFLNALRMSGSSIQFLVAFTHAEGDTALGLAQDGQIQVTQRLAGPELRFSNNEYVTLEALDTLSNALSAKKMLLLANRPLVMLNGCETGSAALYEGIDRSFPTEFLQMGARGVIATEAPIWTSFGYDFGSALVVNLKSGQSASLALLSARQTFLEQHNNPLGLLYSYYGGVKASVKLP